MSSREGYEEVADRLYNIVKDTCVHTCFGWALNVDGRWVPVTEKNMLVFMFADLPKKKKKHILRQLLVPMVNRTQDPQLAEQATEDLRKAQEVKEKNVRKIMDSFGC
jgi:hypothetical protein